MPAENLISIETETRRQLFLLLCRNSVSSYVLNLIISCGVAFVALQMLLLGDDITGASFLLVFQGKHEAEDVTMPPLAGDRAYDLIWDSGWERPGRDGGLIDPGHVARVGAATMQVYQVV